MTNLTTIVVVAAACVAVALPLLAFAFTARPSATRVQTLRNLNRDLHLPQAASGPQVTGGGLVNLAKRLTPSASLNWIDTLLSRAGRPAAWPLERVIVVKLVLTAVVVAFGFLVAAQNPSVRVILVAVFFAALAWVTPELLLYSRGQERRQAIQDKLPDVLDH